MNRVLGLAFAARKISVGTENTIKGVKKGSIKLVMLANDASNNTKKLVNDKCSFYNCTVIDILSSSDISNAIGRSSNIMVVGITDEGFSKLILNQKRK